MNLHRIEDNANEYNFGPNYVDIPAFGRCGPSFYRTEAFHEVANELARQDKLRDCAVIHSTCGDNTIDEGIKLSILTKKLGDVAAIICDEINKPSNDKNGNTPVANLKLRNELIEVAATAIAWVTCLKVQAGVEMMAEQKCRDEAKTAAALFPIGSRVRSKYTKTCCSTVTGYTARGYVIVRLDKPQDIGNTFSHLSLELIPATK